MFLRVGYHKTWHCRAQLCRYFLAPLQVEDSFEVAKAFEVGGCELVGKSNTSSTLDSEAEQCGNRKLISCKENVQSIAHDCQIHHSSCSVSQQFQLHFQTPLLRNNHYQMVVMGNIDVFSQCLLYLLHCLIKLLMNWVFVLNLRCLMVLESTSKAACQNNWTVIPLRS